MFYYYFACKLESIQFEILCPMFDKIIQTLKNVINEVDDDVRNIIRNKLH